VLLLDEPTAALDPDQRRRLWERVAGLRARGGAVVFATQNLEEVERIASRVAALREGRLVFTGTRDEYDRAHVESLSA
jgi:ABC-type multidrug transport system ATPase subunit